MLGRMTNETSNEFKIVLYENDIHYKESEVNFQRSSIESIAIERVDGNWSNV